MFERERKFIVKDPSFVDGDPFSILVQGYLFVSEGHSIRVRRTRSGEHELAAFLAVKGPPQPNGREKFETEISLSLASSLMLRSLGKVVKSRYQVVEGGQIWTVDIFHLGNQGLTIAELEVGESLALGELPDWCGDEVSNDPRYFNENLAIQNWSSDWLR